MLESRGEVLLLIAFVDLTRFAAESERVRDVEVAEVIDAYYERVATTVAAAGGQVVKFIGDAALIVFSEEALNRGVQALLDLKDLVDHDMEARGWECRLTARAHFGNVIAGPFGAAGDKRFDVIGRAVITAAKLTSTRVTLSEAAYRKMGPGLQRRFQRQNATGTHALSQ